VGALVLTSPERHGAAPGELRDIMREFAHRGFAVLTVTTPATRELLSKNLLS
jgi:hypothetical protein